MGRVVCERESVEGMWKECVERCVIGGECGEGSKADQEKEIGRRRGDEVKVEKGTEGGMEL